MTALMPRRLGLPARAQISNDDPKASVPQRERYEWLESRLREFKHLEPVNAQTVLEQRLPEQGVTVIVGEPGAGKSVLAATWREHFETQKRTCILLEGGSLESKLESGVNILLKMAEHPRAKVSKATKAELERDSFPNRAVLMVDALDELPSTLDERLAAKILEVAEHHLVILTCRTAVWANRVKEKFTRILGQTPQTYTLLGFTPDEQREFLNEWAKRHAITAERAGSIAAELQARPQLSYLAANPLMLDLIAQVTLEMNKPMPDSRAELYGSAILELLNRSHQEGDSESWGTKYEPFMRALAMASVQANPNQDSQLETELDWDTVEQALEMAGIPEKQHMPFLERLQRSGLVVRVGDKAIPKRRFIHLTLQEYALASAWLFGLRTPKTIQVDVLSGRLQGKLLEHWWQPNFESTLSLALSIASKHGANLHDPIMAMLASWERGKPSTLRTALHLANSANVTDEKVIDRLFEVLRKVELGTHMAATDPECPKNILEKLITNEDPSVRWDAATNPNIPASVFEKFANKDWTSGFSTSNANMPASLLEKVLTERDPSVHSSGASNPNIPASALEKLATNDNLNVRSSAASNPNMPANALEKLATDKDWIVRWGAARNPNYIPETHPTYPRLTRPSTERTVESKTNPRVFISYTHDSPEHDKRILEFSNTLRNKGIDAQIDQYQQNPEGGWPTWMSKQLQQADFIIMVFTQTYKRRFDNAEEPGKGLGGVWEGAVIIKNDLYARHGWDKKFIPVIFDPSDQRFIPLEFQHVTYHVLPRDLEKLVDYVRGHNPNAAPPLGSPTSD
jgi:hypothetical protein